MWTHAYPVTFPVPIHLAWAGAEESSRKADANFLSKGREVPHGKLVRSSVTSDYLKADLRSRVLGHTRLSAKLW